MNTGTKTNDLLQGLLDAQNEIASTRDALLRATMALPNNLQYLAEGGSFASTLVDLVRAIGAARQASHRGAIGYLRGTDEQRATWDAECAEAMRREVTYTVETLQGLAPRG